MDKQPQALVRRDILKRALKYLDRLAVIMCEEPDDDYEAVVFHLRDKAEGRRSAYPVRRLE